MGQTQGRRLFVPFMRNGLHLPFDLIALVAILLESAVLLLNTTQDIH